MHKKAKIKSIQIPENKRVICISDIHGEIERFQRLLEKVAYNENDILILLGDIYTKGRRPHDTLRYCMTLDESPNVHILRGNADWGGDDFLSPAENQWLAELPDIIESDAYTFVHSGLTSPNLYEQLPATVAKVDNFIETATPFAKWVVVGHWPVAMYCHQIACHDPIVNHDKKIIAIDGGNVLKSDGQLNAFIIQDGRFTHTSVDDLPTHVIAKPQQASGGTLNITWLDRFIEWVADCDPLSLIKHLKTNKTLTVPKSQIWTDNNGNLVCCDLATDYHLPCKVGDEVKIVEEFEDRYFAKRNGVSGWVIK
ncbi:MAG: metallophosphoesterase [Defluviitaleaceae bacterium]|nr:metallophosphoesterase [Defluviitaleaceae bacterium]